MDSVTAGTAVFLTQYGGTRFLMQQRAPGRDGEGLWSVPGGRIEPGESWQRTSMREVREETGIKILEPRLMAVTVAGSWLTVWSAHPVPTTGRPSRWKCDEVSDSKWVEVHEALDLPLWREHWEPLLVEAGGWSGLQRKLKEASQ